jgi:hypothetical protein
MLIMIGFADKSRSRPGEAFSPNLTSHQLVDNISVTFGRYLCFSRWMPVAPWQAHEPFRLVNSQDTVRFEIGREQDWCLRVQVGSKQQREHEESDGAWCAVK